MQRQPKISPFFILCLAGITVLQAQTDPGPRGGVAPPIPAIRGLTDAEVAAFQKGKGTFEEVEQFQNGLGPRFNLDSCAGCHSHPSTGGSSAAINPQVAAATRQGALNQIPDFIQVDGPTRVVRFRRQPNGGPDGGVHALFVISGRNDAPAGCAIQQPDFSRTGNLVFRIPTPLFGLGLIEAISDNTLKASLAADADRKGQLGIGGRFNTSGNDGTIARFGWKAQNKSLMVFAGEAYNVEMGVTNDLFPQEREEDAACSANATPEDHSDVAAGGYSDTQMFTLFMRFLAPPAPPGPPNPSVANGRDLFDSIGCAFCHTPRMRTGKSSTAALSEQDVNLFSDLAIHRMGQALNDGVTQGAAQGDEWRTAPLWGLGARLFFLHDGRSKDLMETIGMHDSQGSEARTVTRNFNALPQQAKQDVLNFLRSL